jgi:chemotaxis protein CheY-P-specific phosphatase CheC
MIKKIEAELYKSAALTFENLGFLLPTPEINEQQWNAPAEATVLVEFEGPFCGRMLLKIYGGLLPTLAANMLGEEETPSKSQQDDALGEIANVICGHMLPGIAGSEGIFHVSPPRVVETTDLHPVAEVQVGLGQGRADLLLFISRYPGLTEE